MSDRRIRPFPRNDSSREVEEGVEALSEIFQGIVGLFRGSESSEDMRSQQQPTEPTNRSSNRNAEVALGAVAGAGIGLAVAGAAYYLFSNKSESATEPKPNSSQSFTPRPSLEYGGRNSYESSSGEWSRHSTSPLCAGGNEIVIAVDATKQRAGGILRFPKDEKGYFYSIDWSDHFNFSNGPDKFEMTNIFLALHIFEEYVSNYRNKETASAKYHSVVLDMLVCKNDSVVWGDQVPYKKAGNATFKRFYEQIENKLQSKPFYGRSQHSQKQQDDDIRMADKLSRERGTNNRELPKIPPVSYYYDDWTWYNLSMPALTAQAIHDVKDAVPSELKYSWDC